MTANKSIDELLSFDFLSGANVGYLDNLLQSYSTNPDALEPCWRRYFDSLGEFNLNSFHSPAKPSWSRGDSSLAGGEELGKAFAGEPAAADTANLDAAPGRTEKGRIGSISGEELKRTLLDSIRALMVIRAYRIRGHLIADLDPLGMRDETRHPELEPASFGFSEADMDRPIFLDNVLGLERATMREIIALVKRTYCGTFALQYMHISDPEQSSWLKERIEGLGKEIQFTRRGRRAILNKLVEAEGFEKFLHVKYPGTKRFGLDGAESLIPAMEQVIKRGGALGVKEIIIGMPHRGRLNVLANVMGKPYRAIFNEFQGGNFKPEDVEGSGDVKYHLGASADREFDGNSVHLSLTANPSHLEAVNPVALGKARAKQFQYGDEDRTTVLPLLLHGDAAFAGQGVVAECFGLSGLAGHRTGGTLHLVVNNQIGFTATPHYSRSSPYPTDIALMTEAPIFHVNGDDPEAVVHAAKVATEFRQKFAKDAVIDMFCYRRFGHNEGDEPMFTQPKMYRRIKSHKSALQLYGEKLTQERLIPEGEIKSMAASFESRLKEEFEVSANFRPNKADWLDGRWSHLRTLSRDYQRGKTGISRDRIEKIGKALTALPSDFSLHRSLARFQNSRAKMFETGEGVDWATAEAMAFGGLLLDGYPVRLAGQDSTRGTFSQRHAAFVDQKTENRYFPLNFIENGQEHLTVIDSMLSEFAVLGFEYGYSLSEPNTLVLWEAQFGDFANGAQIMIDQFVASGESKWLRMSGLVVLLPHGYEGQGPEHSSARIERFLQLSAEDNWIVANCTTPANYFHILRRQMHRDYRKPLVLFTPKSLLRHKKAVSKLSEFEIGSSFHRVLWDDAQYGNSATELVPDEEIKRVVLTSGKVYYDLLEERDRRGIDDIYLMRIEQYHPVPNLAIKAEITRFRQAEFLWCQEEPKNQGAWTFLEPNIERLLGEIGALHTRPKYVGRPESASPAGGLMAAHSTQQKKIVDEALS
ncbi:MAG: 2-oxoglutarate dehydrogenase E1 component [Albidovulum sp.]|nr:2-oxoglutarate dehydrogenase E1 component [Albidovulum sp.]